MFRLTRIFFLFCQMRENNLRRGCLFLMPFILFFREQKNLKFLSLSSPQTSNSQHTLTPSIIDHEVQFYLLRTMVSFSRR
jgi:hypothetical protein